MSAVDNSIIKAVELSFADHVAKLKDQLTAATANAALVVELNGQIVTKDQTIADLTNDLATSQAEAIDLGNKLKASDDALAAIVTPPAS